MEQMFAIPGLERRMIRERPVGAVSAAVVLLLCLVAIFADVLAPFHFMDMTMVDRLQGPSSTYPLGTDHIGRDVLSRLLYGARVSLAVGFAATTLSVLVSLLIGGVAGGSWAASWTWRYSAWWTPGCRSRACCCC